MTPDALADRSALHGLQPLLSLAAVVAAATIDSPGPDLEIGFPHGGPVNHGRVKCGHGRHRERACISLSRAVAGRTQAAGEMRIPVGRAGDGLGTAGGACAALVVRQPVRQPVMQQVMRPVMRPVMQPVMRPCGLCGFAAFAARGRAGRRLRWCAEEG